MGRGVMESRLGSVGWWVAAGQRQQDYAGKDRGREQLG